MKAEFLVNSSTYPVWLEKFIDIYQKLEAGNLHLLKELYGQSVVFIDPIHQLNGIDELQQYFEKLYSNIQSCTFKIDEVFFQEPYAAVYWTMQYIHPKLNGGNLVTVHGHSKLKGHTDKVIYHRDYLDLGSMIYEQIPLLKNIIRWLKFRLNP